MHVGSPDAARAQDVVSRWSRRARSWRRDGRSHRGRGARPTTAPVATSTTGGVSPVDAGATDAEGGGERQMGKILAAFLLVYYVFSLSQQLSLSSLTSHFVFSLCLSLFLMPLPLSALLSLSLFLFLSPYLYLLSTLSVSSPSVFFFPLWRGKGERKRE